MKQYILTYQNKQWFGHDDSFGDVVMGNHADIHHALNILNPMLTEHFDNALECLREKHSFFAKFGNLDFCLTRIGTPETV